MMCFGLKDRKRLKTNHCVIVLLDDTQLVHELHASSTGQDLLDVVIKHLNLLETSYFGLRFFPDQCSAADLQVSSGRFKHQQQQQLQLQQPFVWLNVEQSAIKQLRDVQPMTVYFGVKYYAPDPCKLAEEITRYQFFLQCKQDIIHGRLPIPFDLAIELFALAVQSELGDYDPQRHQDGYVGEFQFLPTNQTLELERRVALFHRSLTGQVPATAELNFLERVKWLDLYGSDLHPIQYDDEDINNTSGGNYGANTNGADEYALGLSPSGVSVLRNKLKVAHYVWSRIVKTKCQGRCFLMDVTGNLAASAEQSSSSSGNNNNRRSSSLTSRQRFGFRLADKQASRRLRLSLEQHKSFYHLINNSATLNQLVASQQLRQKLSQRFRHSIRSAIPHFGAPASATSNHNNFHGPSSSSSAAAAASTAVIASSQLLSIQHQLALQHQQQQQRAAMQLRSSMKSHQYTPESSSLSQQQRQQPAVVRMPSRRYGSSSQQQQLQQQLQQRQYPTNGLPPISAGGATTMQHAHTMLDHQRQQALLMMNQLNNQQSSASNAGAGAATSKHLMKSATLKPISSKQAAANREKNQYYHQMMMAMMANQQQQQQQQHEAAILPPGRHPMQQQQHQQPNIYKSSSVINGINQLDNNNNNNHGHGHGLVAPKEASMMQQFFNTRPEYPHLSRGHESPRSTKSAIAPSSALKLASKKLAKQQQQLLYGGNAATDIQPLLAAFDPMQQHQQQQYSNYYGIAYNVNSINNNCTSANVSPRSARSARLTNSRHKSKSTNENLHLLHNGNFLPPQPIQKNNNVNNNNNSKMLLATATQLMQQQQMMQRPPPPNYNGNVRELTTTTTTTSKYSDNSESELANISHRQSAGKQRNHPINRRQATFALSNEQANILLSVQGERPAAAAPAKGNNRKRNPIIANDADADDDDYCCSRSDCSSIDHDEDQSRSVGNKQTTKSSIISDHKDWNSIRRRHENFSRGKAAFQLANTNESIIGRDADNNNNNNNNNSSSSVDNGNNCTQLMKNITNKQATPILLSMNFDNQQQSKQYHQQQQQQSGLINNQKAVQLLNLQRQQLNSSSSTTSGQSSAESVQHINAVSGNATKSLHQSSPSNSTSSSVASSPKQVQQQHNSHQHQLQSNQNKTKADSTVSNSTTTSGYYAGSNSTGSAGSADSDSQQSNSRTRLAGSRAKIALGSYSIHSKMSGDRLLIGNQANLKTQSIGNEQIMRQRTGGANQQKQQFYLGDQTNNNNNNNNSENKSIIQDEQENWQQQPSSLKYVSFDV